jgi:hypothetical protein
MCKTIEGFQYLALSEPNPQKKFHRLGWIVFKEGTDMDSAYEKLNEQKVYLMHVRLLIIIFLLNFFFLIFLNRSMNLFFILLVIRIKPVLFVIELLLMLLVALND